MPAAVTAWAVELGKSSKDRKGTLSLEADALRFSPTDGSSDLLIGFTALKRVKRLRGSPVLMALHDEDGSARRTAFYFVQPPPLDPMKGRQTERAPNVFSGMARTSKRRLKRENASYLGLWNREKKQLVTEWVEAIRSAAQARG